ncbi:MAG: integrin alpha, partial [Planctomycetota bacterium]
VAGDESYAFQQGRVHVFGGVDGAEIRTHTGGFFGGRVGASVDGAGRCDGDAHADVVIGAPQDECDCPFTGHGLIVSGASGAVLHDFQPPTGESWTGWSVAGVGDKNGDGFDDVLIGVPSWPFWTTGTGKVWLLSGRDGSEIHTFEGDAARDFFGADVARAGDVDGDGVDDMIIGASQEVFPGTGAGYARVFSGDDFSELHTLYGIALDEAFGTAVAGIGDLDGDGLGDLAVGAAGAWYDAGLAGRVTLFSGSDGGEIDVFVGESPGDRLGRSVAALGDVDNDGVGDLLVGAPGVDAAANDAGRATAYSGATGNVIATFDGTNAVDGLGRSVAGGGDLNGDGMPDAVIGVPGADPGGHVLVVSLVPVGLSLYGGGTPGCIGPIRLSGNSVPAGGHAGFAFTVTGAPPRKGGLVVVTDAQDLAGSDPFGLGVTLHVDIPSSTFVHLLGTAGDANGVATAALPIPANPALVGRTFYAQALWNQGVSCGGPPPDLAGSNGLALTVQ